MTTDAQPHAMKDAAADADEAADAGEIADEDVDGDDDASWWSVAAVSVEFHQHYHHPSSSSASQCHDSIDRADEQVCDARNNMQVDRMQMSCCCIVTYRSQTFQMMTAVASPLVQPIQHSSTDAKANFVTSRFLISAVAYPTQKVISLHHYSSSAQWRIVLKR